MADVDLKLPPDTPPTPGADPISGLAPEAPAVVGYLASFAMTAVATRQDASVPGARQAGEQ
jgi:two-component system sensor histidine kinase KdpD